MRLSAVTLFLLCLVVGFIVPGQDLLTVLIEQPLEKLSPLDVADRLDEAGRLTNWGSAVMLCWSKPKMSFFELFECGFRRLPR